MNNDIAAVCDQAERSRVTVLHNLDEIGTAVREVDGQIGTLPFFARGFIASEVARGSGQDIPAWTRTITAMTAALRQVEPVIARVRTAGAVAAADCAPLRQTADQVDGEAPRFEKLATFIEKAPSKLSAVPSGFLPADQRGEFLTALDRQLHAVRNALAAMPELSRALRALSGQ